MKNQKVFVSHKILNNGLEALKEAGLDVHIWPESRPITQPELIEHTKDCDALISMLSNKIDDNFLKHCPKLKVISNYAVGFNNIDIEAATNLGIAVGNTPDVLTEATADLAMALLLNVSRKITPARENVLKGEWINWEPMGFLGKSLAGKTLGIYGLGRIGQAFAKRCVDGFGMKLLHTSRSEKPMGTKVELEELLKASDVLSIHCPLTPETNGLLNKERLLSMKKDSILINTARGEVVNQKDLEEVLGLGHFFGVGLDVTTPEPLPTNSPLLKYDRVLVVPHIGSADIETRSAMSDLVARNILAGLEGKDLPAFINPEVRGHKA